MTQEQRAKSRWPPAEVEAIYPRSFKLQGCVMNHSMSKLFAALLVAGCATERAAAPVPPSQAPAALAPAAPEEPVPALRLPADVKPTRYALSLTIDPDAKGFSGAVDIDVTLTAPRQVLWLHGLGLAVTQSTVRVGGLPLAATYAQVNDDGVVKLTLPRTIGPGPAVLHLEWTGRYDPKQVGLYLAHEGGANYAYTQFEDIYARRAFPGFDEPGFKTPFEVTLVVPNGAVAVANTQATAQQPADATHTRFRYAPTQPLPTYLVAWAVGPFDVVEAQTLPPNALRSWPVPVRGIAPKGRGGDLAYALKAGSQMLLQQEQYFGLAYPYPKLDQVAVPDYAYGAMENAGEIHYREDLLLFKEGVSSEQTRADVVETIAHEQAHQWFGDLVTFGWWEEAWLNESFATWFGHRTVEQWQPGFQAAIDLQKSVSRAMGNDALVSARAIRQPLRSVKDITDQFDGLTYQKGGGVLAMFERFIGAEKFRKGVSAYLAAHAHGTGSTEDLLAALSKAAGQELGPAFHTFLDQSGVPLVKAKVSCGAAPTLALEQSRYFPLGSTGAQDRSWKIPLCVRYAVGGKEREQCTLLEKPTDTLALEGCPTWLMPNAAGAGYYRWALSGDDLEKLRTVGYRRLAATERIAFAQNLRSAALSGALPLGEALKALEPVALDAEAVVALEAFGGGRSKGLLGFARDQVLNEGDRARVDAYSRALFAPVLTRVGFAPRKGEDFATGKLRVAVLGALAQAQEPRVIKELTRMGRAYAGTEAFRPEQAPPDLAGLALGVAVEHGDLAFLELLLARLAKTDDAELRDRILEALAEAKDAAGSARALAISLDPGLRKQEGLTTVFAQARDPRTREASWAFLKQHYDALVAKVPKTYAAYTPLVATAFCEASYADELQTFFGPRAAQTDGMAKNLRQAAEEIRLCAAQATAQRPSALAFFTGKDQRPKLSPAR